MDNSNHNQQQQVAQPQPLSMAAPTGVPPQQRPPQIRAGGAMMHHGGGHGGGGAQPPINIQNEIMWIKQDAQQVRGAVLLLEAEKDSLRKAIRKLKLENTRLKQKVKTLSETVNTLTGVKVENGDAVPAEAEKDYDELDRNFFLIGGIHDPLSLRYEVVLRDADGIEHKSAERYYWYKMAELFKDTDSMKKILQAANVAAAEEAVKAIKTFDEAAWDKVKLQYWEEGQRFKCEQVRWIACLLVMTEITYLACASQDKFFGTGWRKNREEANKTIFWDGENEGGKVLMKIRHDMKATHTWNGPQEEEDTRKKFNEMKRYVWRRIDPTKRVPAPFGGGRAVYGAGYRTGGGGGYRGAVRRPGPQAYGYRGGGAY